MTHQSECRPNWDCPCEQLQKDIHFGGSDNHYKQLQKDNLLYSLYEIDAGQNQYGQQALELLEIVHLQGRHASLTRINFLFLFLSYIGWRYGDCQDVRKFEIWKEGSVSSWRKPTWIKTKNVIFFLLENVFKN
jgi:hypothetical protein